MNNLNIDETRYTPLIKLETNGNITMTGKSYPENTIEFYQPVLEWIEDFFTSKMSDNVIVDIEITYFNSSSSKFFFNLFDLFDANKTDNNITINWIYEEDDESSLESGEDFIEDFPELNINLVIKK